MTSPLTTPSAAPYLRPSPTLRDGEYDFGTPLSLKPISEDSTSEEFFGNLELCLRKASGDSMIYYAQSLHSIIVLTALSDDVLKGINVDVRDYIEGFSQDIQNRIKTMIWRLHNKPDEDPIECGNSNLTDDLEGTAIAIYLAGRLETENLDDKQIDDLMRKVAYNSMRAEFNT